MTLTYDEVRDQAQLDTLDDLITDFIEEYHRRGPRPKTGERSTLILFPGGMGSSLLRSKQKFDGTVLPKDAFDEIWLHPRTFAGAATLLGLSCRQSGYRDDHEYPIVAKGAVHLFDETPYTGFGQWCAGHGLGFFTYGYDWRRPYADVARFFVDRFLPRFQERVRCECDYDPLENLILLGHSLGGMVVNWLLRKHHAAMPGLKYAITAATPFYGYGGQVGRWFKGEPLLDHMGTATIVEVVSSLPAMYTLSFLDGKTYDAIEDELAKDCTAPLPAYPSIEYSTNTVRADPVVPASTGQSAR